MSEAAHFRALSTLLAADDTTTHTAQRHLQILAFCCARKSPISVRTISQAIALSHSATSRAVDRMVDDGLLTRRENAADRRLLIVETTERGREIDRRVKQHYRSARAAAQRSATTTLPAA